MGKVGTMSPNQVKELLTRERKKRSSSELTASRALDPLAGPRAAITLDRPRLSWFKHQGPEVATIMSAMEPENKRAPPPIGRNGTIPSLTRTDHGLMECRT